MKKKISRHYFNMIEVALALAIIAIGLSSVIVLFPIGFNANKTAIANNNIADISEFLMSHLRAGFMSDWGALPTPTTTFSGSIASLYPSGGFADEPCVAGDSNWSLMTSTGSLRFYRGNSGSCFLYQQITEVPDAVSGTAIIPDFSVVAKVWTDNNISVYGLNGTTGARSSTPLNNATQYIRPLCIELSWPAEAPYANREKLIFHLEIFNEYFTL